MTEGILIRVVITIAEVNDLFAYQRQFCAYYRVLEDDFCATEKYLTVNPDNYSAYSTEFLNVFVKYEVQQKAAKNPTPVSAAYV